MGRSRLGSGLEQVEEKPRESTKGVVGRTERKEKTYFPTGSRGRQFPRGSIQVLMKGGKTKNLEGTKEEIRIDIVVRLALWSGEKGLAYRIKQECWEKRIWETVS